MDNDPIADAMRRQWIIFAGLISAVGVYGVIAWFVIPQMGAAPPLEPIIVYVMCGVAVMLSLQLPFLRRRLLAARLDDVTARARQITTVQILSWAMADAIAIIGLVLVFLTHVLTWYWALGGLALLNFAAYRPSEDLLRNGPSQ